MSFPTPQNGLVISYSYLWRDEARKGLVEGRKNRPCAILLLVQNPEGGKPTVTVAPITHTLPADPSVAIEIPATVKAYLKLDGDRSWAVLDDLNVFIWPGYDLAPVPNTKDRYDYGLLPSKLHRQMLDNVIELRQPGRASPTPRDDD